MAKFEIFISYRRKGGFDTAKLLYDRLRLDGYSISFDIDTLEKGNFDDELESRVKECKDFLLVLSPGIFDRFFDSEYDPKDDWVRREISCALEENKNIIPLFLDGFDFPKQPLPQDVKDITRKNGIDLNPKHFESAYAGLKRKFLISQPRWTTKHKKKIIAAFSLAFLAIAACLSFVINKNISDREEGFRRVTDSIAVEKQRIADSIATEKQRIIDSITMIKKPVTEPAPPAPSPSPKPSKPQPVSPVTSKSFHCASSGDKLVNIICEKLAPAGVKKTECSGNGVKINVIPKKAGCRQDQLGKVTCSYSPKLKFTDCNGASVSPDLERSKIESEGTDENKVKKEIEKMLEEANFSQWVSKIKSMQK